MKMKNRMLMTIAVILLGLSNRILNVALWFSGKAGVKIKAIVKECRVVSEDD